MNTHDTRFARAILSAIYQAVQYEKLPIVEDWPTETPPVPEEELPYDLDLPHGSGVTWARGRTRIFAYCYAHGKKVCFPYLVPTHDNLALALMQVKLARSARDAGGAEQDIRAIVREYTPDDIDTSHT